MASQSGLHHRHSSSEDLSDRKVHDQVKTLSKSGKPVLKYQLSYQRFTQSCMKLAARRLMDVDTLTSAYLGSLRDQLLDTKTKNKLPPLKPPDFEEEVKGSNIPIKYYEKNNFQRAVKALNVLRLKSRLKTSQQIGTKHLRKLEVILPPTKSNHKVFDVSLKILHLSAPKAELLHVKERPRNMSEDRLSSSLVHESCNFDTEPLLVPVNDLPRTLKSARSYIVAGDVYHYSNQLTSTSDIIEKGAVNKGVYPYLISAPQGRTAVLQHETTFYPLSTDATSSVTCSCTEKTYIQSTLHYQELFHSKKARHSYNLLQLIYVDKKSIQSQKLVIALVFDGLLGDSYKRCLYDTSPKSIRLRKNTLVGLHWLQQSFRLVFLSFMPRKRTMRVLAYFRSSRVIFDAAYNVESASPTGISVLNYSQILSDLSLDPQKLLVVSSIDLSYEDLEDVCEDSLYVKAGSKLRLTGRGLPYSREDTPVTLLVPSLKAQPAIEILPFDLVASRIHHLGRHQNWFADYNSVKVYPPSDMVAISTSVVYEVATSHVLPPPKALEMMSRGRRKCTLHCKTVWESPPSVSLSRIIILTMHPPPSVTSGVDILETKALRVKTGFLNLLDYTIVDTAAQRPKTMATSNNI